MASVRAGELPIIADAGTGGRRRELEDRLNLHIYHPLAARLARLLRPTGVSPHALSVAGALLVWGAAWSYSQLAAPAGVVLGFTLHLLWHVFDGADGDLARLRGTASATGELVDGVCDYSAHTVLYIVLAAMLDDQIGDWAWALATAAGASHIAQTNHAETQRRSYLWWAYGIPWLKHAQAAGDEVFQGRNWFSRAFGWMARDYLKLANAMTPQGARLDRLVEAAGGDPAQIARIRRLSRRSLRTGLKLQKLLGPNPRTIILGASMALGSPIYFFLAEVVLLNLVLVISVGHHERVARALAERVSHAARPRYG